MARLVFVTRRRRRERLNALTVATLGARGERRAVEREVKQLSKD